MTVKLSRYYFKKIGGKIVPIRKGLELATKDQSKLAEQILNGSKKKIGSGVDFNAFTDYESVIKTQKTWGGKITKGTANYSFHKAWPETKDKLAVAKALSDNLPNFGIPTTETRIIRINKKQRGLLQPYVDNLKDSYSSAGYIQRSADSLFEDSGLNIDAHYNNIKSGRLIDSGGNLMKSKISKVKFSDTAKELLGIDTYYGTKLKDHVNKAEVITERVAIEGQSKKALRKLNSLMKKGYKFFSKGEDGARLINPIPQKNSINTDKIKFVKIRGRIVPIKNRKQ